MTVAALLAIYADAQTAFLASLAALGRDDHAEHRRLMQRHADLSDAYLWGWLDVQGMTCDASYGVKVPQKGRV